MDSFQFTRSTEKLLTWVGAITFDEILWQGGNFPWGQLSGGQFSLGAIVLEPCK